MSSATRVVRVGPVSARVEARPALVSVALATAALAVGLLALHRGASWSPTGDVLAGLVGQGRSSVVVLEWRLPRVAAALGFGASLGLAGAVIQNLARNPLGSPDVVGLDAGAFTGALLVLVGTGGAASGLLGLGVAGAAVAGGLAAAVLVLGLAADRAAPGMVRTGLRLVVVGIAVNAMLTSLNSWIVLRAELEVAMAGTAWNAGTLNGLGWSEVAPALVLIVLLAAALALLSPALHQLGLGDDLAGASGVELGRLRWTALGVAVAASAVVTAVAGPIMFVALAAPQIGRRLTGAAGVPLVPAAATGALLLVTADLVAQVLLSPESLPVGVVTTAIGGGYLVWLLARRRERVVRDG